MRSYHHRQVQIAEVLVRYGMGYLLELLGIEGLVSLERRLLNRDAAQTRPEDLRLALEELGPTSSSSVRSCRPAPICCPPSTKPSYPSSRTTPQLFPRMSSRTP
jgi:hypothetical protein